MGKSSLLRGIFPRPRWPLPDRPSEPESVPEVTSSIGKGGMGEVWREKDTRADREVAIKILPQGFAHDAEFRERFDRETKLLAGPPQEPIGSAWFRKRLRPSSSNKSR